MANRILFTHYGEEWIRGSEQLLLDLLGNLDRNRIEPIVWCNGKAMAAACRALNIVAYQSHFEYYFHEESPPFSPKRYYELEREALRIIKDHGIELIHANSGAPNQWLMPVARTARIPILAHLHIDYRRRSRYTLGLHQVSLVVGVSKAVVEDLVKDGMPRERTQVIYNGVDAARLRPGEPRDLRRKLGIPSQAVVITAVGSLIRRKGHDVLLDAFRLIQPSQPETHLLIASDGPDRGLLEEQARRLGLERTVHFLGYYDDLAALYRDETDLLALASRTEAFGLVLAEAALFGVPAVASTAGGVPEVVLDGQTGLLAPPEDPAAFAAALKRLIEDRELRSKMGAAAQARALENFTVQQMTGSFHAAYERLLAQPIGNMGWLGEWNGLRPYLRLIGV